MTDRRHLLRAAGALALAAALQAPGAASAQSFDLSGVAEDPALAARVPARIREAGVLAIGSDNAYAPWEYLAGEDGQTPEGIDVDLAGAIGATLGLDVDFQTSAFDAIIPSLGTKFDLGVSALSVSEERMEVVDFVHYVESGSLWAVPAGNPGGFDPADICGSVIAVESGSVFEGILAELNAACEAEGEEAAELLPFGAQTEAMTRVAAGGADATVGGDAMIGYAVAQSRDALETMAPADARLSATQPVGIAVAKGDDELTQLIADALDKLIADGTYMAILDHWGVGSMAVEAATVNPDLPG